VRPRTRSSGIRTLAAVVLLLASGCAPDERAPATPPPVPADLELWPHVWERMELPAQVPDAQLNAVAAGDAGFVAVGAASTGPGFDGIVWWSADGASWTDVGMALPLDAVDITDVAWGPAGWVVVGQRQVADQRWEMLTLVSADGATWREPNAPAARLQGTAPAWIESDGEAYLVGATIDGSATSILLRSADGTGWAAEEPGPPGRAVWGSGRWLGLGRGAVATSPDSRQWTMSSLEGSPDGQRTDAVLDAAEGRDGILAVGLLVPGGCGAGSSCPASTWGWRSDDGGEWRILPRSAWPFEGGPVAVTATAEERILAAWNNRLYASWDGWHWAPLVGRDEPAPVPGQAADIAARGERVVIVGIGGEGVGSPWIATAGARE
jgi:hypothetical protein